MYERADWLSNQLSPSGLGDRSDADLLAEEDLDSWDDVGFGDDGMVLGEILRGSLHEAYADAQAEYLQDAVDDILDSMSPAEAFNFKKALGQIGKGAAGVAKSALPIAGGAVGLIGGPAGAAAGSALGNVAAKAIPSRRRRPSRRPRRGSPTPAATAPSRVAGGSAAAARGLVLTQQPEVLKALLALALGEQGRRVVDGVPIGGVLNMLSGVFGQAAADADELLYMTRAEDDRPFSTDDQLDSDWTDSSDDSNALYEEFMEAENEYLLEAVDWL